MPIKEEPLVVKFVYEPDDRVNFSYELKFECVDNIPYLEITKEKQYVGDIHVEVLSEVIDNLRAKNLIQNRSCQKSTNKEVVASGKLQLPSIIAKDIVADKSEPFSSFSLTDIVQEVKVDNVTVSQPEVKNIVSAVQPEKVIELIKRPVLKSRVTNDDDPMGAEKEAAMLRGSGNAEKSIKRKE